MIYRTKALQRQLETETKERKSQEKRNEKYASANSRRGGMLANRKELLENRVKELEHNLTNEKETARNAYLEREDALLNIIRDKKKNFEKARLQLVSRNDKLNKENDALKLQFGVPKRKIYHLKRDLGKRIKL